MVSITNEYATVVLPVVSVTSEGGGFFNWEQFAWAVYGISCVCFVLASLWQIASIIRLKNRCKTTYIDGVKVYMLRNDEGPFSFFNWIFIHLERHSKAETDEISDARTDPLQAVSFHRHTLCRTVLYALLV